MMDEYTIADIPGRPDRAANLVDMRQDASSTILNMGQVVQDFIGSYILVHGKPPERLRLSPSDTDEYAAYMYLTSQGKNRHLPTVIQGVRAEYDCERTALA